ncbi:MFS transporter [Rhodococcus sp. NPDC059968]|uniref:MFS transporter n=1 Tax=Rhodococcus sp. NPDC059968 TaxID=3347017 RepID=UPI00366EC012
MTRTVERDEYHSTPTNSSHPRPAIDRTTPRRARFAALGSRNFRLFLLGQAVVTTGLWVQRVAQDWLVLDLTGSATAVGITTALQWAPMLVFGLLGGWIADRYSKRRVLQATQTAAALLAAVLAGLTFTDHVAAWHVQLLAAGVGTIAAIEKPVRSTFATDLVGPCQIHSAVSLSFSVFYLGSFAGPAISGVLITTVGPGWAFALNAVSFAAPLIALARIDAAELPHSHPRPATRVAAVPPGGVRALIRRPEIWRPMVLASIFGMFTLNLPVTLATYARTAHAGPAGYAVLTSTVALGSVVGALIGAIRPRTTVRALTRTGFVLAGLYLFAAAMPTSWSLACTLAAIGIVGTQLFASANAAVQLAAGAALRGRMMGVYLLVETGGAAVGGPLLGVINEYLGPRVGLVLAGAIPAAFLILLLLTQLTRRPAAGVP